MGSSKIFKILLIVLIVILVLAGIIMLAKYYFESAMEKATEEMAAEKEETRAFIDALTEEELRIYVEMQSLGARGELEEFLGKLSDEELKPYMEVTLKTACVKMIIDLKEASVCEQSIGEARDLCYYCFATIEDKKHLCDKISKNELKEACQQMLTIKVEQ